MTAPALDAPLPDAVAEGPPSGWRGPILPVNIPSGDGREMTLVDDNVPARPLPLPLNAQYALDDAHKGSVVIGLITRLWVQDGAVWAEGTFDLVDPVAADWAARLARGMAGWVSADLSDIAVTEVPVDSSGTEVPDDALAAWLDTEPVPGQPAPESPVASWLYRFDQWKVMGATLVSSPAFEGARISPATDVPALTAAADPEAAPVPDSAEPADPPADGQDDSAGDGDDSEHTGAMVALLPAAEDAQRLAVAGGEAVEELHVTLAYLGEAADWTPQQSDAVRAAIAEIAPSGPLLGEVWGHALFNPDTDGKDPCAVYLVGADGLSDFRAAVLGAVLDTGGPVPEQHDPFVPHVTAGYGLPVEQLTATGPVRFDRIRIAFAGQNDDIPLEPVTAALTAAAVVYNHADFATPEPDQVTALTVTEDGRVFGHLALYDSCHIGYDLCVSPPTSASDYAYFHQGEIRTDTGTLAVGKITLGTGHASMYASARTAAEHYDNTGTAVAVVRCRDGALGPWLSGRILPGVTDDRVDELRRSGVSGDWRGIRRGSDTLELVAVLAVNVPGFPVPRTRALAASGIRSLIAAGSPRRRPPAATSRGVRLDDLLRRRRVEAAGHRMRDLRVSSAAVKVARLGKERHVRTPEGSKKYGKPIGSPIEGGAPDLPDEDSHASVKEPGLARMPPIRELFDLDDRELFDTVSAGFNGHYGRPDKDGHRMQLTVSAAEIETTARGSQMINIHAQITDDATGRHVGTVQRVFHLDSDGDPYVEHALLQIHDDNMRGRGFSTDLFTQARAYYERSEASRITLFAGLDDGGWAWARAGFEWHDASDNMVNITRSNFMGRLMEIRGAPSTSSDDSAIVTELAMRFAGPIEGWPSPMELTTLTGDNPHLGALILRGSEWYGVMWLI